MLCNKSFHIKHSMIRSSPKVWPKVVLAPIKSAWAEAVSSAWWWNSNRRFILWYLDKLGISLLAYNFRPSRLEHSNVLSQNSCGNASQIIFFARPVLTRLDPNYDPNYDPWWPKNSFPTHQERENNVSEKIKKWSIRPNDASFPNPISPISIGQKWKCSFVLFRLFLLFQGFMRSVVN